MRSFILALSLVLTSCENMEEFDKKVQNLFSGDGSTEEKQPLKEVECPNVEPKIIYRDREVPKIIYKTKEVPVIPENLKQIEVTCKCDG